MKLILLAVFVTITVQALPNPEQKNEEETVVKQTSKPNVVKTEDPVEVKSTKEDDKYTTSVAGIRIGNKDKTEKDYLTQKIDPNNKDQVRDIRFLNATEKENVDEGVKVDEKSIEEKATKPETGEKCNGKEDSDKKKVESNEKNVQGNVDEKEKVEKVDYKAENINKKQKVEKAKEEFAKGVPLKTDQKADLPSNIDEKSDAIFVNTPRKY